MDDLFSEWFKEGKKELGKVGGKETIHTKMSATMQWVIWSSNVCRRLYEILKIYPDEKENTAPKQLMRCSSHFYGNLLIRVLTKECKAVTDRLLA